MLFLLLLANRISRLSGFLIAAIVAAPCQAAPDIHSAKNEFADNPFMAIGVNPRTNVVTGYFSALLTAPGKTDACKFVFHGSSTPEGKVRLAIKDAVAGNQDRVQF